MSDDLGSAADLNIREESLTELALAADPGCLLPADDPEDLP
jgi:hypothetical protein